MNIELPTYYMMSHATNGLYHAMLQARIVAREAEEAFKAAMLADCPYKVGQVIQNTRGDLAKIVERYVRSDGEIAIHAILRKKDGTWDKDKAAPLWRTEWKNPLIVDNPDDDPHL